MEFEAVYRDNIILELAKFCCSKVPFCDQIKLTTSIVLLVDDVAEYRYNLDNIVTLETKEKLKNLRNDVACQTELTSPLTETSGISTTKRKRQTYAKKTGTDEKEKNSKDDTHLADDIEDLVKEEHESDTDGYEIRFNETDDEQITRVIPSSPLSGDQESDSRPAEEIACPLCPAKFQEKLQAENHLKENHDIGNIYICSVCQDVCPSNTALIHHVQDKHNFGVSDANSTSIPQTTRRSRKTVAKKVEKKKSTEAMKNSNSKVSLNITVKTSKGRGTERSLRTSRKINSKASAKSVKTLASRNNKINEKKTSATVKCKECGKMYQSKRAERRHAASRHPGAGLQCDLCGRTFTSRESLYYHKRGIHSKVKSYKCDQCDAAFSFNHSLRLHRLKHSGQRPHKCSHCEKTYLTTNHLKIHVEAIHGAKNGFKCKICDKTFSYKTSLKMHEFTHSEERPYKCKECGKGFINSQACKYHMQSKHSTDSNHMCDICGKKYKTVFLLRSHRRRHTTDGTRYMCDVCGRLFMYKSTLEVHSTVHSDEKAFTCTVCGKSFKTYATLYSHQYVHQKDSPYKCGECGKAFKTKERLKAHERRHSGQKPFDCDMCGRCFPDKGGLAKHQKSVHCLVKKFLCNVCGKACSRADNLRVHMKIHDKQVPTEVIPGNEEFDQPLQIDLPTMVPVSNTDHSYHSYQNLSTKRQKSKSSARPVTSEQTPALVPTSQPINNQAVSGTQYAESQQTNSASIILISGTSVDSLIQTETTANLSNLRTPQVQSQTRSQTSTHPTHTIQQPAHQPLTSSVGTLSSQSLSLPTPLQPNTLTLPQGTVATPVAANQPYMYPWPTYGTYLYGNGTNMQLQPGTNNFYQ